MCQFWALLIQQQKKIRCQKYGQMGVQLSDLVENITSNFFFSNNVQKLSVVDAIKMNIYGVKG